MSNSDAEIQKSLLNPEIAKPSYYEHLKQIDQLVKNLNNQDIKELKRIAKLHDKMETSKKKNK